jgi:ribose/xylose/arabinose/galactoside ABC-type transport system permease subunit
VGYVVGTLFGVLILGVIQTLITFEGTLSSWWTKIVIGLLLFAFCLMQRVFESGTGRLKAGVLTPLQRKQAQLPSPVTEDISGVA